MATVPQYVVAAEGFDIYPAGNLSTDFPWNIVNSSLQGTIVNSAGAFGGNALQFPVTGTNSSGTLYSFLSTMNPVRSTGNNCVITVSGWINVGTPTAVGTSNLIVLGNASVGYTLIGITNSTAGGLNLVFPTTLNNIASSPYQFAISPNTQYWVVATFAFNPAVGCFLSYAIDGNVVLPSTQISWTADVFTAGTPVTTLSLWRTPVAAWLLDDFVIQSVSSTDARWPGGTAATSITPQLQPRRVVNGVAIGNGPTIQMAPSGSEPNWQSATDPTGTNFVTATDVNQTDLYSWTATGVADVKAIIYRGSSNRWGNLNPQQSVSGVQSAFPLVNFGPSRFLGVTENDGTNAWTASSIAAAFFGQESH